VRALGSDHPRAAVIAPFPFRKMNLLKAFRRGLRTTATSRAVMTANAGIQRALGRKSGQETIVDACGSPASSSIAAFGKDEAAVLQQGATRAQPSAVEARSRATEARKALPDNSISFHFGRRFEAYQGFAGARGEKISFFSILALAIADKFCNPES
jgi:hypothetical protein